MANHAPGRFMYIYARMRELWGDEFDTLTNVQAAAVGKDMLDTLDEGVDSAEYFRRIRKGNLLSYANCCIIQRGNK